MFKEENRDPSIEYSAPTPYTNGKETSGFNEKHHSTSKCKSETVSFRDNSFQEDPSQLETFDPSIYEARILKAAYDITIIDNMIFDDNSELDLSSIYSGSQDNWIHNSESTDDSSLDN